MNQDRQENNGFGPVPAPRGWWAGGVHCALLAAWMGWFGYKVKTGNISMPGVPGQKAMSDTHHDHQMTVLSHYLFITAAFLLATFFSGLLHSVGLYIEERKHVNSRHGGRYMKALQSCLHFRLSCAKDVLVSLFLIILLMLQLCSQYSDLLVLLAGAQLLRHTFMEAAEVEVMGQIEGSKQNVATGLAWSFYTGYLKIVLPGLRERIEKSVWRKQIHPTAHRLLVLIPLKCEVRAKLEDGDPNIKNCTADLADDKSLPPVTRDRAGIKGRVYKNDVHRITDPTTGRVEYCVVEYATNVQTLYEMQTACEGFSREAREQQVKMLYYTLKNIIDDDFECRDKVVLVPLDITDDEDHKLSRVILQTLDQLKCGTVDMPDEGPDVEQDIPGVGADMEQDRVLGGAQATEQEDLAAEETVPKVVAAESCDCIPIHPRGVHCQESQDPPLSMTKIMKESAGYALPETMKPT